MRPVLKTAKRVYGRAWREKSEGGKDFIIYRCNM